MKNNTMQNEVEVLEDISIGTSSMALVNMALFRKDIEDITIVVVEIKDLLQKIDESEESTDYYAVNEFMSQLRRLTIESRDMTNSMVSHIDILAPEE